jgi:hypothetical protein
MLALESEAEVDCPEPSDGPSADPGNVHWALLGYAQQGARFYHNHAPEFVVGMARGYLPGTRACHVEAGGCVTNAFEACWVV